MLNNETKARLRAMRAAMDGGVTLAAAQGAAKINDVAALIRPWKPGAYAVGDVRAEDGVPYKCVQAHDSAANPDWKPSATPALWMQYHGSSRETARAYVAPSGAHDMYRAGEWMIYTDGVLYECLSDTAYSPTDYAAAWKADGGQSSGDAGGGDAGADEWPEFVQPTGAHDAYQKGDKITFNGKRYICQMDNCAYSPAAYAQAWAEAE